MKKIMTILCIFVQGMIISVANLYAIALVLNWLADTIGYHGLWNIPMFFVVSAMVCATLAVYLNSIVNHKL